MRKVMRSVSAAFCVLSVMVTTIGVMALPALAQAYPPSSTTPTSQPGGQGAGQGAANLAFTGSDSAPLLIAGIVALTLGAVVVVATRRRGSMKARAVDG